MRAEPRRMPSIAFAEAWIQDLVHEGTEASIRVRSSDRPGGGFHLHIRVGERWAATDLDPYVTVCQDDRVDQVATKLIKYLLDPESPIKPSGRTECCSRNNSLGTLDGLSDAV